MAINTQTIRIDLNTGRTIPVAFAHQNDTNRQLTFQLYNNGEPFTPSSTTVKFGYISPIVNGGYTVIAGSNMASGSISGNVVTFTLPSTYTAVHGVGLLTMILTSSGKTIRPINIKYVVQRSADGPDAITGASDFPTTLKGFVDNWFDSNSDEYLDAWLTGALADQDLESVVNNWLDGHPEATTTVQDGSLNLKKFSTHATGNLIFTETDLETFITTNGTKAIFGGDITLTKSHTIEGLTTLIGNGCIINLNGHTLEFKNLIDADASGLNFIGTDKETSILKVSGSYSSRIDFGYFNNATLYITTGDATQQDAFESTIVSFVGLRYSDVIVRKGNLGYITSSKFCFGRYYHGSILIDGNYESLELFNTVLQTLDSITINNLQNYPLTISGCYVEFCDIVGYVVYKNCAVHDNTRTGTTPKWAINEYNQWWQSLRRPSTQLPTSPNFKLIKLKNLTKAYTNTAADGVEYVLPVPSGYSVVNIAPSVLSSVIQEYGAATVSFDLMITEKNGSMSNNAYTGGSEMYFSFQPPLNEYKRFSITLDNSSITSLNLVRRDNSGNSFAYKIKNIIVSSGYVAYEFPPLNDGRLSDEIVTVNENLKYTLTNEGEYLYEFNKNTLKGQTITITISDDPVDRTDVFEFSFGYYDQPYPNWTSGYVYGRFAFTRHSGYSSKVSDVEYVAKSFFESTTTPTISISADGTTITITITKGSSATFEINNLQIKARTNSRISITANAA